MKWLAEKLREPSVQFTLAGLLAIIVVGGVAAYLIGRAGNAEAIRDAKRVTSLTGQGIVEPAITPGLLRGDPAAVDHLDDLIHQRVLGQNGIERVKIWDAGSRIVYSDEPRLLGRSFQLGDDDLAILRNGGVDAGSTDLSSPENQYENPSQDLFEVYLQLHAPDGTPLLYETYIKSSFIASNGRELFSTLGPVMLGAVLLLAALQLPLAASLTKRLRRGQREREALLRRSIDASETERRRIAQDLHDTVVQDLAGTSYAMAAAAERATRRGNPDEATDLRTAASQARASSRELRGLMVEIYPPDLRRAGLHVALSDIGAGISARGVSVAIDVAEDLDLPEPVEALIFRAGQEALRNVVAHARASHADLRVTRVDGTVRLEVTDDGVGIATGEAATANGHFGLRTIRDLTEDAGGRFAIESAPGKGTTVRLELPLG